MKRASILIFFTVLSHALMAQISIMSNGNDIVVNNYGVSNTYPKDGVSLSLFPSSYVQIAYEDKVVLTIRDYNLVDDPESVSFSDLFYKLNDMINMPTNTGGGGGIETETDPTVPSSVKSISGADMARWNKGGDSAHYHPNLPVLNAISASDTSAYRQAFSWGNHALAGYLTSISASDVNTALGYTAANAAALNASNLTTGTVPDTRIGANILRSADAASTYQTLGNLSTDLTPSTTKYPSVNAVNSALGNYLTTSNANTTYQTIGNLSTDLTASANKYPSVNAVNTGLGLKANLASPTFTGTPAAPTATANTSTTQIATTAFVTTADNLKANINSPTLTGVPAAPTAVPGTNTTQIATTGFVAAADALKADLNSPTFTGTPSLPTGTTAVTQTPGASATTVATTEFVTTADNLKANLVSPAFTGAPTAPTATPGTNTTQLATTEYVQSAVTGVGSNYITTNTTQTGLTGDKTTGGLWTFNTAPAAAGLTLNGSVTFGASATYDIGTSGARGNNAYFTNHISSATAYFGTISTSSGAYIRQGTTSQLVAGALPSGNFMIQAAGTPPTDGGERLQVFGTARITGNVNLASIPALGIAGTNFLTSNSGIVSSRTATQVLSDIGGEQDMLNSTSSASTVAITTAPTYYTATGTTSTYTLPAISGNTGLRIVLINSGSGVLTLNTNAGGTDIDDGGTLKSTLAIASKDIYSLYNNGVRYIVIGSY